MRYRVRMLLALCAALVAGWLLGGQIADHHPPPWAPDGQWKPFAVLHAQQTPPFVNFVYAQGTGAQGGPFTVTSGAVVQPSTVATGSGNAWASDAAVYGCSLNIQTASVFATDGWTSGTNTGNGTSATPTTSAGNLLPTGTYYFSSRMQCLNLKFIAASTTAQWYMDIFK